MEGKDNGGHVAEETQSHLVFHHGSTEKVINHYQTGHTKNTGPSKAKQKQLKPTASKEASRLEDQMNFEHLKLLESIFNEADTNDGGGLAIDEFRTAMKRTMGSSVRDEELDILFMKVDTNCDGTVDWDEYLSYMLLEYQEKDTMTSLIKEVPFPNPLRDLHSNHRDNITRISFLQNLTNRVGSKALDRDNPGGKYLVLSREGQLGIYGLDFELQKSFVVGPGKETCVQLWMTDMAPCANVALIAVSSTEREISFYDISGNKLERKFQLLGFKDPILTMNYWFNYDDLNCCTLVVSEANGSVIVFRFYQALRKGLFGVYPQKGVVRKIAMVTILKQKIPGAYCLVYENLHSNLVNSAQYFQLAQGLECFLSCSATDEESMYLGDLTNITYKPKWPGFTKLGSNRGCYYKIRRGILALDYSKEWNLIVTGSFDGVVRTWNPGSCKPASVIKSHHSPVQHCTIIAGSGQIITCGKDRTIKVTELRDHSTTQVIAPRWFTSMGPPAHKITSIFYQKRYKALLIGTMQVAVLEGYDDNEKIDQKIIKSHDGSVSTVLYNKLFNQVVTAGHDSVLSVWDLNTGTKAIQFYTVKGVELTCLCFDQSLRRLITGSRNGAVKIWNFNNGACLRTLTNGDGMEITGIVCHKQQIITAGWNKKMTVYLDTRDPDDECECMYWKEVHQEDILCVATFHHSNGVSIAASCSYDGNIYIWSLDSGHVLCRLNRMLSYAPLSSNGVMMDKANGKPKAHQIETVVLSSSPSSTEAESESEDESTIDSSSIPDPTLLVAKPFQPMSSDLKLPEIAETDEGEEKETRENDDEKPYPNISLPKINVTNSIINPPSDSQCTNSSKSTSNIAEKSKRDSESLSGNCMTPSARAKRKSQFGIIKPLDTFKNDKRKSAFLAAKKDPTRHQLRVLTGQEESNYWEADVSVDRLLFLQSRPHAPNTATLLSAGAFGWVHAWSVHPQGGLLGQFMGAHYDGEVILALATNKENSILITGDSFGYIKIWNINDYCYKTNKIHKRVAACDLLHVQLKCHLLEEEELQSLSSRRLRRLNTIPPEVKLYFRAHVEAINDIAYVEDKKLILSACADGTVRMWSLRGLYIGTFGQKQRWDLVFLEALGARMPAEIKRVASFNTLRVLNFGHSSWRQTKNILKVAMSRLTMRDDEEMDLMSDVSPLLFQKSRTDLEMEQDYEKTVSKLQGSTILGNAYSPQKRHRHLPKIDLRPHLNNYHVHSSIPFSSLRDTEEIPVPELLKEKWRLQKEMAGDAEHKVKQKRVSATGFRGKVRMIQRNKGNSQTQLLKNLKPTVKSNQAGQKLKSSNTSK